MRPLIGRAAPERRVDSACVYRPFRLAPALALALALVASLNLTPWLVAEAEAGRGDARARTEASQPRSATTTTRPAKAPTQAARGQTRPARATAQVAKAQGKPAKAASRPAARPRPVRRPVVVVERPSPPASDTGPAVTAALGQASRATGIDPLLLVSLAWQESRFDPRARNRRSTARGLMQFTEATWLEVVRDFGPRHGLAARAAQLETNWTTGAIATRQPRQMREILGLRDNPRLAALLAAERISRARAMMQESLGRTPTSEDLYLVHLLGPAGAQRFLAALARTPSRPAAEFVSNEGLTRNRELFADRDSGQSLSVAEVHGWVGRSIAGQRALHGPILGPILATLGVAPVMEVADAR